MSASEELNPRLSAFRPDLADARLKGQVQAESYVDGQQATIRAALADLRRRPDDTAPLDSQLMQSEQVLVFERKEGWAWVQCQTDNYVGYLRENNLGPVLDTAATHRVSVLRTPLFTAPDIKSPVNDYLSLQTPLHIRESDGRFLLLETGGWVYARHAETIDSCSTDWTATALSFLGTPYLWGGRSSLGLDCSALVQLALAAAGVNIPRDSDQQEEDPHLGERLAPSEDFQRGDLLYWPGHVAIALGPDSVVNATASPLQVVMESFHELDQRAQSDGGPLRLVRRPVV
ncbi:MAG: NlpC/P60 family protein [Pseudomonadota bacterium]